MREEKRRKKWTEGGIYISIYMNIQRERECERKTKKRERDWREEESRLKR